jgi:acyl-CoA dehydrogenase
MMTGTELLDPFNRLLDHLATPAAIRAIEAGGPINAMWDDLEASGYLDALLPEHANGAGLTLHEVGPLLCALGYHAVVVDYFLMQLCLCRAGRLFWQSLARTVRHRCPARL